MNETMKTQATETQQDNGTATGEIRRSAFNARLAFYHANSKGTGCAIQFSVEPASAEKEGAVFFSIARQKTAPEQNGERRFASFDWTGRLTVKLSIVEVAEMIMVMGGQASSVTHGGKEGFFHNSPSATTALTFRRSEDPTRPGFLLGVGRTPKSDMNAKIFLSFAFQPSEAFVLRTALLSRMGDLAFGCG